MAYTIKFSPPQYSSLHDNLVYTVAYPEHVADPVTYPNYKFIGDIYVGGTMVARIKRFPDPSTGIGIFDVAQIVRSYLETKFDPTFGLLVAQEMGDALFRLGITMKFGEEYGYAEYVDELVDSERIFFNSYNGRGTALTPFIQMFANKIASTRPVNSTTRLANNFNFFPFFPTSTSNTLVTVTPFGGGIPFNANIAADEAYNMLVLNVAPGNLNYLQPGTINASTQYYTVAVGSQTYRFDIICEPTYEARIIHFLNKCGGFESKLFTKVSRYSLDLEKKTFGKLRYTIDSDGIVSFVSQNKVYNDLETTYSSQFTEKKTFNTDLLTDQEYSWLSDLMASPMIYLEEQNGDFFPVVIKNTDYDVQKIVNDGPTSLTLNIEYGQTLNAQFR